MGDGTVSGQLSVTRHLVAGSPAPSSDVPIRLLTQGVRRLRIAVGLIVLLTLVFWVGVNTLEGDFLEEFQRPGDWIPPTTGLLASLAVFLMTRSQRFSVIAILQAGLAYEVLVSYSIAVGQYWNTFHDLPGERLTPDLVGISAIALWMAFFTVLVPTKPRHALVALTLSGAAVPVTVGILIRMGNAPAPPAVNFFTIFILPYLITVFLCMVAAHVIYGLGRDVGAAQRLGSYRLLSPLGSGGMGTVWLARHDLLARPAAIKLVHREALAVDPIRQEEILARFEREAQATASLQSPHTVELYDFGVSDDGNLFYVMELLSGIDLRALVQRFGPTPPGRVVHILQQVCASLAEAHERGLVHRDIKPANIMLCEHALTPDFVKVLDFGLVKRAIELDSKSAGAPDITEGSEFVGTPAYVAPELVRGSEDADGRADIYSLGCVGFWLLTGRPVFVEDSAVATLVAHTSADPEAPSRFASQAVSPALDRLILDCLAKSPAKRPVSAEELAERLEEIATDEPWGRNEAREWWTRTGAEIGAVGGVIGGSEAAG